MAQKLGYDIPCRVNILQEYACFLLSVARETQKSCEKRTGDIQNTILRLWYHFQETRISAKGQKKAPNNIPKKPSSNLVTRFEAGS